jgi:hypothetical protein
MFTYPGGFDPNSYPEPFASRYRTHLQHLKLKGLQPKTIDAYARGVAARRHNADLLGSSALNQTVAQTHAQDEIHGAQLG